MAGLTENSQWEDEVYQIETTDPVVGGAPDLAQGQGITNAPHQQLANRTGFLKAKVETLEGRKITAGTGLSGGGALDQDRSLAVVFATEAETKAGALNNKSVSPLRLKQALNETVSDLALGSAATSSLQESSHDTTVDAVMTVPSFGLGLTGWNNACPDINDPTLAAGFWRVNGDTLNTTESGLGFAYGTMQVMRYGPDHFHQIVFENSDPRQIRHRIYANGWSPWRTILTDDAADYVTNSELQSEIDALLDGAPAALDTLNELAEALGDNDSEIAALVSQLATKLDASEFTGAEILEKLRGVDGSGTGLDADRLDGLHAWQLARLGVNNAGTLQVERVLTTQVVSGDQDQQTDFPAGIYAVDVHGWTDRHPDNDYAAGLVARMDGLGDRGFVLTAGDDSMFFRKVDVQGVRPWRRVWTDANDGPGSGLNADMLDGFHASAFWRDADAPKSLTENGYQVLPSGLIIQWMKATGSRSGTHNTLPITFPNALFTATTTDGLGDVTMQSSDERGESAINFDDSTTSSIKVFGSSGTVGVIAIGY